MADNDYRAELLLSALRDYQRCGNLKVMSCYSWASSTSITMHAKVTCIVLCCVTMGGFKMAILGFIIIVLFVLVVLTSLPKPYRCQKCGFETINEDEASGHVVNANTHKMIRE